MKSTTVLPVSAVEKDLFSELSIASGELVKAKTERNLERFDLTVDKILTLTTALNNSTPLASEQATINAERWPRGTNEVRFEQQVCFAGKVVADMRASLVAEARAEGLLPKIETKRINLWSSPRNVSTALMRSFEQRSDTRVFDEPLYGSYLEEQSKRAASHPQAQEVIGGMLSKSQRVIDEVILAPHSKSVVFFKQMTHHLYLTNTPRDFLHHTENVLLTRNPRDMIPSLTQDLGQNIDIKDTGYEAQALLLNELHAMGKTPIVLDAELLLADPESVLVQLCQRLNIPFEEVMLSWPSGPSPFNGNWGKYWYGNVDGSTGFGPYKSRPVPANLETLVAEAEPYYQAILEFAIRP